MGYLKYIRDLWKNPRKNLGDSFKEKLINWRKEPVTVRVNHPTRIDRARSLGYKAKQGVFVVRQRVISGGRQREKFKGGRRPKHSRRAKVLDKSYQQVAEERASKKYKNCEVLNSYYLAGDSKYHWFEIIMVDPEHPAVRNDPNLSRVANKKKRAFRGLTKAGRKSRAVKK